MHVVRLPFGAMLPQPNHGQGPRDAGMGDMKTIERDTRQRLGAVAGACVLLLLTSASAAVAQTPRPGELGTLEVPGGAWALAELGVPPTLERASVPRVLVQRLFDPSPTVRPTVVTMTAVLAGLDLAVQVESAARVASPGGTIALAAIKTKQSRSQVEDAMEAIGARLREKKKQYSVTLETGRRERDLQAALKTMGLDVADVVARLNKGETVAIAVPAVGLPLPFSPATWAQVFERTVPSRALFAEILRTPTAMLFWYGALALDPATRRFLEASPDLVKVLAREAAPIFASYSAAVAVRDGRVQIAGGAPLQALWEALVDEPVSSPARFVRRLFSRDGGRLAMFFDLIQRLPTAQRTFAAGLWIRGDDRTGRFRDLYEAVRAVDGDWDPAIAPLKRAPNDPWLLLRGLPAGVTTGNGLAGPQPRKFWQRAFEDGLPDNPADALKNVTEDGLADAAWFVEHVCHQPVAERAARFRVLMSVSHAFPAPAAADLPGVLMAARGLARFPALFTALERSDLLTAATAQKSVRQADAVDRIGGRDERAQALAALQGGVALVDRAVVTGALPLDRARGVIGELMAVPLADGRFGPGVALWLVEHVIPALEADGDGSPEARVTRALSMAVDQRTTVEWEGERYTVDWRGLERRRIEALRKAQGGVQVDHVVQLVQLMRQLPSAAPSREAMREPAAALLALGKAMEGQASLAELSDPIEPGRLLTQAARELERVQGPKDRDRIERTVERLGRIADWMSAHLLVALAYTPHLGDPTGAAARAGAVALRHHFGVADPSESQRRDDPWRAPTQGDGGNVSGALVGLDGALARQSLRRLSAAVPRPSGLTTLNIEALAAQVALASPRPMMAADLSGAVTALGRGRERVRAAHADATALEALAAGAGIVGERRSVLAWMAAHEADRVPAMFTLPELLAAGEWRDPVPDAFGTPSAALQGRWRLAWPALEPWDTYAGRPTMALMASQAPDLTLRVIELLVQSTLPMELVPAVMAYAVQDLLDDVTVLSSDDWLGLARFAPTLKRERFEDIVSALAGVGLLVPATGGQR